jgi:hypothetical protein
MIAFSSQTSDRAELGNASRASSPDRARVGDDERRRSDRLLIRSQHGVRLVAFEPITSRNGQFSTRSSWWLRLCRAT